MACSDSGATPSACAASATSRSTWSRWPGSRCPASVTGSGPVELAGPAEPGVVAAEPGFVVGSGVVFIVSRVRAVRLVVADALERHETVADVTDGADQGLVLGAQLGPQPPDMHVHRAGAAEVVIDPDLLQQVGAGENAARVLGQKLQQLEFLDREVQRPAAQPGRVGGLVDGEVAGRDLVRRG